MACRPLLQADEWARLIGVPTDDESLILNSTLCRQDMELALNNPVHARFFSRFRLPISAISIGPMENALACAFCVSSRI